MKFLFINLKNIIFLVLFITSCATSDKKDYKTKEQEAYLSTKKDFEDKDYLEAIVGLDEFISKFPYSKNIADAQKTLADAYFNLKNYSSAAISYQKFMFLYPDHKQIDYIIYKVGMCYWNEAPDDADQAQQFTKKSIDIWQGLRTQFPNSDYIKKIEPLIVKGQQKIAESKFLVAKFYFKQKNYHSSIYLLKNLINKNQLELHPELTKKSLEIGLEAINMVKADLNSFKEFKNEDNHLTKNLSKKQWISFLKDLKNSWIDLKTNNLNN